MPTDTGADGPYHRLLVDDEHEDYLGKLKRGQIGPLAVMQMVNNLAGEWPDGRPRLPNLDSLIQDLKRLPTSEDAERAELVAETIGRDRWQPKPTDREWTHPDERPSSDEDTSQPGLPTKGD